MHRSAIRSTIRRKRFPRWLTIRGKLFVDDNDLSLGMEKARDDIGVTTLLATTART